MATRLQQVQIMQGMVSKIDRALRLARVYAQSTVALDPESIDTQVTLTQIQKDQLVAAFDFLVQQVKTDAAGL